MEDPRPTGAPTPPADPRSAQGARAAQAPGLSARVHHLSEDRDLAWITVVVAAIANLTFVRSDLKILGDSEAYYLMLGTRIVVTAMWGAIAVALRRSRTVEACDRLVFFWSLTVAAHVTAVNLTRPPDYLGHTPFDITVVLLFYTVLRVPPLARVVPAMSLSLASIVLLPESQGTYSGLTQTAALVSFALANVLGLSTAIQIDRGRVSAFERLQEQIVLRAGLDRARHELEALKTLLPICGWCKQVRHDDGGWEPVEAFLQRRERAEVTHGICPSCYEEVSRGVL